MSSQFRFAFSIAVLLMWFAHPAAYGDDGSQNESLLIDGAISASSFGSASHYGGPCGAQAGDSAAIAATRAAANMPCPCATATSHFQYVKCVKTVGRSAVDNGTLRPQCFRAIWHCASHSTCGRTPGSVTCCRTDSRGRTKCRIKRQASSCRPSHGGTACVGTATSCCDACINGGCTPTTTTTIPPANCGNGTIDPGETCDPPGSATCPDPSSPGGALLDCQPGCVCPGLPTTTITATTTTATSSTNTTTTTPASCGNGTVDPGEQCDPPGNLNCPDPSSPGGALLECQPGCVCPGNTTTTTSAPATTTTTAGATTTTTVSSTTTTTATAFTRLAFTTTPGTASCGGAGLSPAPTAPLSGEIDSDTSCTASISPLGVGCLYFGGGGATIVPPGPIPDQATTYLALTDPTTLGPSAGTSSKNCSQGAGPSRHCINNNTLPACTTDANCGGAAGACALDANCFFGPPLPIPSPAPFAALTTCVLNVVQTDASGTANATSGDSNVSLPLSSRVYISGNTASPCPKCISGTCDATWKTNTGGLSPDSGAACTPTGAALTTSDCRPSLPGFQAPLGVDLTPLTTGTATSTSATGIFCPGQNNAGAFGQTGAQCIRETGAPAGDLTDGNTHASVLGSVFCIPATGNGAVDGVADLPGPGAIGLSGVAQLQ